VAKQEFKDVGVIYNNLKIIAKVEPKITPKGDRITRVDAECLHCGKIKEYTWSKVKAGHTKSCGCTQEGRRKDLTGERQGKLVAISSTGVRKKGSILWNLKCDCGNGHQLTVSQFTSGHTNSCGCLQYQGHPLDLSGQRFGRLIAVRQNGQNKAKQYKWLCLCDCGNEHTVAGTQLIEGKSISCGCYAREVAGDASRIHGMANTPEYGAWKNAISRCYNPNNKKYHDYGGRGIDVCDDWHQVAEIGFIKFYEDMGPSNGLTLERVDVNLGYSKENCIWDNRYNQGYNTRQHQTNSSGKTGVSENKDGTWQAYINFEGKRYPLGEYKTFEGAKSAREAAEIKYYGKLKGH
jgi:hypothetical protein